MDNAMSKKRGDAAVKIIVVGEERLSITQWAAKNNLSKQVIAQRLKAGWPAAEAVSRPTVTMIEEE
jgi:hypothetical protein